MAITWSITQLDYVLSLDDQTNVINNSHWQCINSDDQGNQVRVYGSVEIPTDDLSNFIPYADITEAKALQWTKDALGSEEVAPIEANVTSQLNVIQNPTKGSGMPWTA